MLSRQHKKPPFLEAGPDLQGPAPRYVLREAFPGPLQRMGTQRGASFARLVMLRCIFIVSIILILLTSIRASSGGIPFWALWTLDQLETYVQCMPTTEHKTGAAI